MADSNLAPETENIIPVLLPNVDEKKQVRQLGEYLRNLQDRLRQGVQEHHKVVQSSVQLLKEVGNLNNMVQFLRCGHQTSSTRIQRLIVGFETVSAANASRTPADMAEIYGLLEEFEHLSDSQVLRESLANFKRARESLEKVLGFVEKIGNEAPHPSSPGSQLLGCPSASRSLREKIEAFNKVSEEAPEKLGDNCRHFKECFCSCCSLDESSGHKPLPVASKTNSGYEGDIDSEVEQAERAEVDMKADL